MSQQSPSKQYPWESKFCQIELERFILYQKAIVKKRELKELKTQIEDFNKKNPPPKNPVDNEFWPKT